VYTNFKIAKVGVLMSAFGDELRKIRKSKNLSLKEVAQRGDLSHSYISQIENGKRNAPKPEIIHKLAKGLDIDPITLMQEAGYIEKNINQLKQELNQTQSEYSELTSNLINENIEELREQVLVRPIEEKISILDLVNFKNTIDRTEDLISEKVQSGNDNVESLIEKSDVLSQTTKKLNEKSIGSIENYNIDILELFELDTDLYYDEILLSFEDKKNIKKFIENFIIG